MDAKHAVICYYVCGESTVRITERVITVRYKTEKEKQFNEIYDVYSDDIYKVCLHLTKKKKRVALRMAQQTFLELYFNFEEIKPEHRRAYLINTAKRLCVQAEKEWEHHK